MFVVRFNVFLTVRRRKLRCPQQMVTVFLIFITCYSAITEARRQERTLVYPTAGVCKLIVGLGIPIDQPKRILTLGINFQFQYALPTNISVFRQNPTVQRSARDSVNRASSYEAFQVIMDRQGVQGRTCLLRTICEVAETPIHHNGLVGEFLHVMFTPGYGHNRDEQMDREYHEARQIGEEGYDCRLAYPSCPMGHGLLDLISTIENDIM